MKKSYTILFALVIILSVFLPGCNNNEIGSSKVTSTSTSTSSAKGESFNSLEGNLSDNVDDESNISEQSNDASSKKNSKSSNNTKNVVKGSSSRSTTSTAPPKANPADSFDETKQPVFKEQVKNLGGKTIKIASEWNEWKVSDNSPPLHVKAVSALRDIEKDYNCKIEQVTVTSGATFINDVVTAQSAGNVFADIIETGGGRFASFSSYLEDVSKVSTIGLNTNDWNKYIGASTFFKGVQHGVGFMMVQNLSISQNLVYFNKTLAEKHEIGDLYADVRAGKWTYDRLLQATQKIVQKTGGDTKGLLMMHGSFYEALILANNARFVNKDNQGYFFDHQNENLLGGLTFWQNYAKSGYLAEGIGSGQFGEREAAAFRQRKSLFFVGDYICASTYFASAMEDSYGILPLPKGPKATGYTNISNVKPFGLIKSPNSEDAGRILVAMAKRTGWNMKEWEKVQLETAIRDKTSLEMIRLVNGYPTVDTTWKDGLSAGFRTTVIDTITKQTSTPAAAMQSIRGAQQAAISSYYN